MSTFEEVKKIVIENLNITEDGDVKPAQVVEGASFIDDLNADSLDTVELVMEFEQQFGVSIPDSDAENIQTVGDAVKYIDEHKK